jgi:hypothetical protein
MTSRMLLDRISPGQQGDVQEPLSKEPLNLPPLYWTLLSHMGQSQTLTSSSFLPNPTQGIPGDSIQSTPNQRMWKRGLRSATGPQSMRSSSHGKGPQQCFEPDLSQNSSNVSTSLMTGLQTPPLLSERSSSHQDVQTSPLTSGSTLSRDMRSTLPKSLERTIPLMSRPSSPKTLETSSSSPFESPSSPKPSPAMGTGLSHLERPSKRSLMPCQDNILSMPPIKRQFRNTEGS